MNVKELEKISKELRKDVLMMTTFAGSGHLTSCLSATELMAVLFFHSMKYKKDEPNNINNDEFILSKGHAAPLLYACLKRAGLISENLNSLRSLNSPLEGHPVPNKIEWIKVATGSLGIGLSIGVGMALAGNIAKKNFRVYVLLGDSEMAEGSNYESLQIASYYKLKNLFAIIDVNRLGQRGETMLGWDVNTYCNRLKSFGWHTSIIDGHNVNEIIGAFERESNLPKAIIAKTVKGKGISFLENKEGWHGKALDRKQYTYAMNELHKNG